MSRLPHQAPKRRSCHTRSLWSWEDRETTSSGPSNQTHTHHSESKRLAGHLTVNSLDLMRSQQLSLRRREQWLRDTKSLARVTQAVTAGLRPRASDHYSLASHGGQRLSLPLRFPNCYVSIRPRWTSLFYLNGRGFPPCRPHLLHGGRGRKQGKKKPSHSSGLAIFWLGHCTHALAKFHLWFTITKLLI